MILKDSTSSRSSAASVFSLREVQLQKDPGHRSSVFQPLGKTFSPSHPPGFSPLLAINYTFNSLWFFLVKWKVDFWFFFLISSRKKSKTKHFLEVGQTKRRCREKKSCLFTPRHKDRRLITLTRMFPYSTCTHLHAHTDAGHFSAQEIALHDGDAPHV